MSQNRYIDQNSPRNKSPVSDWIGQSQRRNMGQWLELTTVGASPERAVPDDRLK